MDTATATPIDWPALRTLAVAVGVREAARRMGVPEETAKKRCTREGWLDDPTVRAVTARSVQLRSSMSPSVPTALSPAMAMARELQDLNSKSRLGLARGLARAAAHVETMDGQEVLADASNVKQIAQATGLVHSWQANVPVAKVELRVTSGPGDTSAEAGPIIEGEWTDDPGASEQVQGADGETLAL